MARRRVRTAYNAQYHIAHREDRLEYMRQRYQANLEAERARSRNRWRDDVRENQFGMVPGQYEQMLVYQNGVCGICGRQETAMKNGRVKALAVDHDHETGIVRGLLCQRCNRALGLFRDDPDLLRKAIRWLD